MQEPSFESNNRLEKGTMLVNDFVSDGFCLKSS